MIHHIRSEVMPGYSQMCQAGHDALIGTPEQPGISGRPIGAVPVPIQRVGGR